MFLIHSSIADHIEAWHYFPCGEFVPVLGQAMTLTDGALAIAGGATKPDYICMVQGAAGIDYTDVNIPVVRVTDNIEFSATGSVDLSAVTPGTQVTITADGLDITATAGGAATVLSVSDDGTQAVVYFGKPAATA